MKPAITLFGMSTCSKTQLYQATLAERGVGFEMVEVGSDKAAASRLIALVGSADKFPVLLIGERKLRNPSLRDLDKELARAGVYDPGVVHSQRDQRFVRHMAPSDAFISYSWREGQMILGHIEVDPSLRGTGLGARFASEVFNLLEDASHEVRLTCPFLRRVGATRPHWREKFALKGKRA